MHLRRVLLVLAIIAPGLAGAATSYSMTFSQGTPPKAQTVPLTGFTLILLKGTPEAPAEKKPVTIEFKPDPTLALFKVDALLPKLVVNKTQAFSGQPTVISHLTFTKIRIIEVTSRQAGPDTVEDVRFTYDTFVEVFEQ